MQRIEYKFNKDISVYFIPLNNGKCEYLIEIHDFSELDCIKERCNYLELQDVLRNPFDFLSGYRFLNIA